MQCGAQFMHEQLGPGQPFAKERFFGGCIVAFVVLGNFPAEEGIGIVVYFIQEFVYHKDYGFPHFHPVNGGDSLIPGSGVRGVGVASLGCVALGVALDVASGVAGVVAVVAPLGSAAVAVGSGAEGAAKPYPWAAGNAGEGRSAAPAALGNGPVAIGCGAVDPAVPVATPCAAALRVLLQVFHCNSGEGMVRAVLEVNTDTNPEFPEEWEFCIGEEASSVTVSTKDAPICFRCRERGHLGTDPACPRSPEHSKEKKLRQNMRVEVEEAKGIWFVNDQDYNGWVFDDTIDDPKWIWTYNTNPSTKQPDIFPPSDSRWHAVGAKKVTGIPGKIHKDQIIDPRAIREEKKHKDLLWDMETIRTETAEACQNTNLDNNTLMLEAKQTLEHCHPKSETPPAHKRTASPSTKNSQEDRAGKKRRATEEGSGKTPGSEHPPTVETPPGTDPNSPALTDTGMDTSYSNANIIPWLEEYLQKAKYEREKEFDIRLACMKHLEKTDLPATGKTVAGIPQSKNLFDLLRMKSELSEFSAALAKNIRDNISAETLLGVYGVPPREQPAEGDKLGDPIFTRFDPILVKLDERAKLSESLTWRAWDTITMMPYSVLNGRFSTTDIIVDSLAEIIRTRLLTSRTSLQDKATPIDVDMRREDSDMEDEEDGEREEEDKISPGGDDVVQPTTSGSSAGEYGLSS
ncbi:hypothetical protein CBR_g84853 [Chara braunii]|uniref:Uncharacterized protein n=1 Tax=Chara braunii TaxID=69332 RepID=A0A388KAX4_CHABU|nr:hypothetical protein CBR_g84853 [Chara braunii]|eukprot:GBG67189.1 hypothetical protein CBR_g84853 [Chara braunii]